jgi:hypothetical protein
LIGRPGVTVATFTVQPEARRHAVFENLEAHRAMPGVDTLRFVMVVMVMIMAVIVTAGGGEPLLTPCPPDHPQRDADHDDRGRDLEVRLIGFRIPVAAEVQAAQRYQPDNRRVRDRGGDAEQYRLFDGAADSDDERCHHRL